jgi:hypothetical protein
MLFESVIINRNSSIKKIANGKLFSRKGPNKQRVSVHFFVIFCFDKVQNAIVSESAPLDINDDLLIHLKNLESLSWKSKKMELLL